MTALTAQSAEKGAETAIYLATSPDVTNVSGKYFDKQTMIPSSKDSYSLTAAKHLWQVSEALVGLASQTNQAKESANETKTND